MDYEFTIRVHLAPFFGDKPLSKICPDDVQRFIAQKTREGRAPKSVRNYLGLLHSIFAHAEKRGWASANPVKHVDPPRKPDRDDEIRFLDEAELEALLRAVPDDRRGPTEHLLYLTAAMTGLRQGELLALRWRDVDWPAGRLRVRQSYVRGEFGTPKSRRSSRSVPVADRVGGALDAHFKRSHFAGDDDLVFCHPDLGVPLDRTRLLKRFKAAACTAALKEVRFHDLRHTFGTRMAAAGVPMRTLQEWMGHRDFKTTLIYADYAPSELVERAFGSKPAATGSAPIETPRLFGDFG
jgi:integrase